MNSRPVETLLARLRERQCNPHQSGAGWAARCPAHDDSTPSLTISEGADGRALCCCQAGCTAAEIMAAVGLTLRDMFVSIDAPRGQRPRVDPRHVMHEPAKPAQDWAAWSDKFEAAVDPELLDSLARELGVDAAALTALRIGWATREDLSAICGKSIKQAAWVFPMMSGHGEIIGLNARPPVGRKWTLTGGKLGLFVPRGLDRMPDPVYLPEGASDTAAALSRGWAAVGRPSNVAGIAHLAELLRGRRVIVVGENDQKGDKWPGRDGARTTAARLAHEWGVSTIEWMLPPDGVKDLREWHRANARNAERPNG